MATSLTEASLCELCEPVTVSKIRILSQKKIAIHVLIVHVISRPFRATDITTILHNSAKMSSRRTISLSGIINTRKKGVKKCYMSSIN